MKLLKAIFAICLVILLSQASPSFAISDNQIRDAFLDVELAFESMEQEIKELENNIKIERELSSYIINNLFILTFSILSLFFIFGFALIEKRYNNLANYERSLKKSFNLSILTLATVVLCFYAFGYNIMYNSHHASSSNFPISLSTIDEFIVAIFKAFTFKETANEEIYRQTFSLNLFAKESEFLLNITYPFLGLMIVLMFLREKFHTISLFTFAVFFSIIIYPVIAAWVWGGGFLVNGQDVVNENGEVVQKFIPFSDFGGAAIVHIVAGVCFITAKISAIDFLEKRKEKEDNLNTIALENKGVIFHQLGIVLAFISLLLLMPLAHIYIADKSGVSSVSVSKILFNSLLASVAGYFTMLFYNLFLIRKEFYTSSLPGLIAGLVAISAEPLHPNASQAIFVGAIAGLIVAFAPFMFAFFKERLYNPFAVHFLSGLWGILAVPISFSGASFVVQLISVFVIIAYVFVSSFLLWFFIKAIKQIIYGDEREVQENRSLIVNV